MTIQKTVLTALSCMMAFSMLSACSSEASSASVFSASTTESAVSSASEHPHEVLPGWDRSPAEHWKLCEQGESFDVGEHTLGDDLVCTVCGSEVWLYDDGSADIYNYNDLGEWTRMTNFDTEGNITEDIRWDYEYNANGNPIKISCYYNDVLTDATEFVYDTDGSTVISRLVSTYYDDGTHSYAEYNENEEYILFQEFDENGTETHRIENEYALDADGNSYILRENHFTMGVHDLIIEYNQYGDDVLFREMDETGGTINEMTHEYTYDDEGHMEYAKFFVNSALVQESFYTFVDNDFGGYTAETKIIYYYEDGTYEETYYSEENDYNEPIRYISCSADGTVLSDISVEYEFDQEMNKTAEKFYSEGVLIQENIYSILDTETQWVHYLSKTIVYNEDGTRFVSEFDKDNLLSETLYDANGNVIK